MPLVTPRGAASDGTRRSCRITDRIPHGLGTPFFMSLDYSEAEHASGYSSTRLFNPLGKFMSIGALLSTTWESAGHKVPQVIGRSPVSKMHGMKAVTDAKSVV